MDEPKSNRNIIVIGASAGGLAPLREIVSRLSADLLATVCVVMHLQAEADSSLPEILSRSGPFRAKWAEDGELTQPHTIYVAPPNRHLVWNPDGLRVLFGPRESLARPAIDVLFRSAAVAFGNRTVGIVLSGKLDDGSRGLVAVKRCGGVAVVMDPAVAEEPEMPRNALRSVDADHVLPPDEIAALISRLSRERVEPASIPADMRIENEVAQRAMLPEQPSGESGEVVSCPDCGGDLRRESGNNYRCRLGHAYGPVSLLNAQQDQLEQALWVALRTLSDRKRVLEHLGEDYRSKNRHELAESTDARANELDEEYQVLRSVLDQLAAIETGSERRRSPAFESRSN